MSKAKTKRELIKKEETNKTLKDNIHIAEKFLEKEI